jgi:UDP-N-acetylmuramoyl-L-alanyl-D-glutamate--2,6-diaminopimelate ligase
LSELAAAAGGEIDGDDVSVSGVAYDSRQVRPGDLFVALRGGYFDGHSFAAQAIDRGAAAMMVERPTGITRPEIVVGDTRRALAPVAAQFFRHPSRRLRVVGVTGTDGKTTTTNLLESILRASGHRTGLIGTVSVRIGDQIVDHSTRQTTPESLDVQAYLARMVDAGVEFAVLEATSHGLDLHRLDDVHFAAAGVTNVTHEHLEHHRTIDAYRRAKAILFERVALAGGSAVVNLDDAGARSMLDYCGGASVLTYSSLDATASLFASDIELGVTGTRFVVTHDGRSHRVVTPLLGLFNVENSLCALGLAVALGETLEEAVGGLRGVPPIPGRMEKVERGQSFTVIVDYAHTPDSLEKVLQLLRSINPMGRLVCVSGSAGERDTAKRPLQGAVSARLADYSVFTTEDPRFEDADAIIDQIADGARDAGACEGRDFVRITDRREAIDHALRSAGPGDCVLLAGKGHERSIIWGLEKRPWNEAAMAAELLDTLLEENAS